MRPFLRQPVVFRSRLVLPLVLASLWPMMTPAQDSPGSFRAEVWPILEARCIDCHGPERPKGKLRLDTADGFTQGGSSGPALVAGRPDESLLFQRIVLPADHSDIMPAKGEPLNKDQIEVIRRWIEGGATFGDWIAAGPAAAATPAPAAEVAAQALAPAEAAVQTAARTEAPADPLAVVATGLSPAPEAALTALLDLGGLASPISQTNPLVRVDLHLLGDKVTDDQVALLAPLQDHITWLNVAGTKVTGDGLRQIGTLRNLTRLNLEKTGIDDEALAHLGGLEHLEYLNLYGTPVTDAGLAHLARLKNLKRLYLWQTQATPAGVDRLKEAVPGVEVNLGTELAAMAPQAAKREAVFDEGSCCAKAQAEGKACDHPCCVEAIAAGKVCAQCNPGADQEAKAAAPGEVQPVRFNRDIRPIFAENCLACHGMDANTRKGGLRLDVADGATVHGAIVPGDSGASPVIHRVTHADPDEAMPPPSTGKRLTEEEVALLKRWIDEGAQYEQHWAYMPPERPEAPEVRGATNPIDAFVRAALDREGLAPAEDADRVTLIRRLSFDLLGLPPTPDEVDAFVKDHAPDAYERLVDRLLASPRYGERMAVDWLDLVRYADTNGYHGDEYRSVWPYRDYVIRAFNDNMPFDRFTTEQIAGDLLPNATVDQKVASAYNRLNQLTAEGGAQPGEYVAIYAADRVRTASTAWLGATMGCAECHDHKFDPFTQKDFFAFAAFFADIQEKAVYGAGEKWEPILPLPTAEQAEEEAQLASYIAGLKESLERPQEDLAAGQARWEADQLAALAVQENDWLLLTPSEAFGEKGTELAVQADKSVLSGGPDPDTETLAFVFRTSQRSVTGLRLETLTHPEFPKGGLSRGNGNFVLTGFEVEVCAEDGTCTPVPIASAEADFSQPRFPIDHALDGRPDTGWAVAGHEDPADHEAVFRFKETVPGGPGVRWTVRLRHESGFARHAVGRFRLSLTTAAEPGLSPGARLPDPVRRALQQDPPGRSDDDRAVLADYYRTIAPELQPARDELAAAEVRLADLRDQVPYTMYTVSGEPRVVRVLPRGDWMDESGEVVDPAVPHFLPQIATDGRRATRLDLARWLVNGENPLTARVYMNRLWKHLFGSGLSKNLDDLGYRGEWPRHPELLDWLAVEFVDSGWDVKHMVRLMVTSATYRQTSRPSAEAQERDPFNRLLARQSRFRLPAEFVRDTALAISGLLTDTLGGPSVKPYQPEDYWADCNTFTGPLIYDTSTGEDQYRRGLYTFWKRSFLHPSLLAFDAPSREECTADRVVSETPLQALVLMNDPSFVEAARVFAERILREGGDSTADRLAWAYRRALGRTPAPEEQAVLESLCARHLERFQEDPEAARDLLQVGQAPAPTDLNPAELAAWTSVARTLLNLHETISRS